MQPPMLCVYSRLLMRGYFHENMFSLSVSMYAGHGALCACVCVCSYPPLEMWGEWRWLPCVARRAGWGQSSPDALSDSGHHSWTLPWRGTRRQRAVLRSCSFCVWVWVYVCVCADVSECVCVFVTVKLKSSYSMLPVNTTSILYFSAFFSPFSLVDVALLCLSSFLFSLYVHVSVQEHFNLYHKIRFFLKCLCDRQPRQKRDSIRTHPAEKKSLSCYVNMNYNHPMIQLFVVGIYCYSYVWGFLKSIM